MNNPGDILPWLGLVGLLGGGVGTFFTGRNKISKEVYKTDREHWTNEMKDVKEGIKGINARLDRVINGK